MEIDDVVYLPYVVVDYLSLFNGKEVDTNKLNWVGRIFDSFNTVFWREPKLFNLSYRRKDKEISLFFDLDSVRLIEVPRAKILKWIDFHKSLVVTDRADCAMFFKRKSLEFGSSVTFLDRFNYQIRGL